MNYKVKLLPSGVEFQAKDDQSILASALANQLHLEYSCANGQCGRCAAQLIEGEVTSLSDDSSGVTSSSILTCSVKPCSDLVLKAAYLPQLANIQSKTIPAKIDQLNVLSDTVLEVILRLPATHQWQYLAGQFIDVLWNGQKRSYSLASAGVEQNKVVLHIKKVQGGAFSQFFFEEAKTEQLLRLHGPLGTFFVRDSHKPMIFICTGTGFAPVKAMVEDLIAQGCRTPVYLYWGGRERADLYCDLPQQWAQEYAFIHYTAVLSQQSAEHDHEFSGYVQEAVLSQHTDLSQFDVYACGSAQMVQEAQLLFQQHGLMGEHFYADPFLPSN